MRTFLTLLFFLLSSLASGQDEDLDEIRSNSFLGGMFSQYAEDATKTNVFSAYSPDEMRVIVKQKSRGKFMGKVFYNFPKFEDFVCYWLVDEEAIPAIVSIASQKKKLKSYGITSFLIFVIGFLVSSYLLRNQVLSFKRIFKKLFHSLLIFGICATFFYFTFQKEVTPTLELIQETML